MIERTSLGIDVICDGSRCQEYLTIDSQDWSDAMEKMRSDGWLSVKDDDGEWEHFCPECKEQLARPKHKRR